MTSRQSEPSRVLRDALATIVAVLEGEPPLLDHYRREALRVARQALSDDEDRPEGPPPIDVLRLARAIEVHRTGKWYDPAYRADFQEAEGLAAAYADLPDEHEERTR